MLIVPTPPLKPATSTGYVEPDTTVTVAQLLRVPAVQSSFSPRGVVLRAPGVVASVYTATAVSNVLDTGRWGGGGDRRETHAQLCCTSHTTHNACGNGRTCGKLPVSGTDGD